MSKPMSEILKDFREAHTLCENRIKVLFETLANPDEVAKYPQSKKLVLHMTRLRMELGSNEAALEFMGMAMMDTNFDLGKSDEDLLNFIIEQFRIKGEEGSKE